MKNITVLKKNLEYTSPNIVKLDALNKCPQKRVTCLISGTSMYKSCIRLLSGSSNHNMKRPKPVIIESLADALISEKKRKQRFFSKLKTDSHETLLQEKIFVNICLERHRNYPPIVRQRLSRSHKQSFKQWFKFMNQNYPRLRPMLRRKKEDLKSRLWQNSFSLSKKLLAQYKLHKPVGKKTSKRGSSFKAKKAPLQFKSNDLYLSKKLKTRRKLKKWRYLDLQLLKSKKPTDIRKKSSVILFEKETHWKRDLFYNSFWFAKFINKFIKQGKKHFIETKISRVMSLLKEEEKIVPFHSFCKIFQHIKPIANTVPKRVGKLYHNIPIPITPQRSYKLVLNWFVRSVSFVREERTLVQRIFNEIISILSQDRRCFTRKLRDALYLQINENRVYTHFRWV